MKIEEGKYYRSREGKKVGPMDRLHTATSHPWISPEGHVYRENGLRYEGAEESDMDLISEWKEEEPAMDYATMNEIVERLKELRDVKNEEITRKKEEAWEILNLIEKIESQYPKPDEEEK